MGFSTIAKSDNRLIRPLLRGVSGELSSTRARLSPKAQFRMPTGSHRLANRKPGTVDLKTVHHVCPDWIEALRRHEELRVPSVLNAGSLSVARVREFWGV